MGRDDEFKVPVGFRFMPTEREIINSYLRPKIMGQKLPCNIVEEQQLYGGNPWKVLDDEKQWQVNEIDKGDLTKKTIYVFTKLTKKAGATTAGKMRKNGGNAGGKEHFVRAAGCGTWDGQTGPREIKNGNDEVIGFRRMFVFKIRDLNPNSAPTKIGHWIMHEYSLWGDESDYVLCEITRYLRGGKRAVQENNKNLRIEVDPHKHEAPSHGIEHPLAIQYPAGPMQVLDRAVEENNKRLRTEVDPHKHEAASHGIEHPLAIQYPAGPIQVLDYKFSEPLNLEDTEWKEAKHP